MAVNIFLFYPNLVGYARIITAMIAFYYMFSRPAIAMVSYTICSLLDTVDGYVARKFNQCTRFGAMLDMLTDRCALMGLTIGLAVLYPAYAFPLQVAAVIDVAAHWLYMVSSYYTGKTSHKSTSGNDNWLMRLYYGNKPFLFTMCLGNEAFYCAFYLAYFFDRPAVYAGIPLWSALSGVFFPIAFLKTYISVLHLIAGSKMLAEIDVRDPVGKATVEPQNPADAKKK